MIENIIQCGRRVVYSLFKAGMHGLNGLNPATSVKLWVTYVIPAVIHSLEATLLAATNRNSKTGSFPKENSETTTILSRLHLKCNNLYADRYTPG